MAELPEWMRELDRRDFLFNGDRPCPEEIWRQLDWAKAYVDMGPSPSGNLGPYWHVPRITEGGERLVHRLYPKLLMTKWLLLVRQAVAEAVAEARRNPDA